MKAVVNPKDILDMGAIYPIEGQPAIITDIDDPECQLQQNGIDLRLDEVSVAVGTTDFFIDKEAQDRCSYETVHRDERGVYLLEPPNQYGMDFQEWVKVPDNMLAYLFVRSSVNRYSGSFLVGNYDSGFQGRVGGIFRPSVPTRFERGFRIAQIVFFRAEPHRTYSGQYQNQEKQV